MSGKREHRLRRFGPYGYHGTWCPVNPGRGARKRKWLRAWKFWKQKEPPRWRIFSRMIWKRREPKWEG